MTKEKPANRWKAERERLGKTQVDVAGAARLSPATVFRVESGERVSGKTLRKIASGLEALRGRGEMPHVSEQEMGARTGPGREMSEPAQLLGKVASTDEKMPSAMGQLIGHMMHSGSGEDPYDTLLEVAYANDDPPAIFKGLAQLRKTAPPGSTHAWWFLRYQDMGGGQKRRPRQ